MIVRNASLFSAIAALVVVFSNPRAQALEQTTYVSGAGNIGGACTRADPCTLIQSAINLTYAGGTVICLTPPFPSPFTVNRAITIDCGEAPGSVALNFISPQVPAAIAINVAAAISPDEPRGVRIIGIEVQGSTGGTRMTPNGILIQAAESVHLDRVKISEVLNRGISDVRVGGQTKLVVKDSIIQDNGGPGIVAAAGATGITVLDRVQLLNNTYGIAAASGNNVVISRSVISANRTAGVEADGGAQLHVQDSTISHNPIGVQAFGSIRLTNNFVEFSNTAFQGATTSLGGNRVSGNGATGTTPTLIGGAPADVFN